ncbi:histidine kinase [Actinoplanes sp. SE50]|uniref:response regulator n=1 Tax=unclassified Actinoplanes TaxID=2626549 RepID=UPI00023ECD23|nr:MULTISPECIES: response regulator [unclassified Actinoplanes]AEV86029.1 multi-sensor signal transduction histidine kinase [Actinoplanes sp. SE50/110]ATO84427.1 histidine kinase [Actinoplanes sp. SE50]SLM01837.1 multi-sensor signal transduction histidine kinase [Actinoplanes sp. SE50/110]
MTPTVLIVDDSLTVRMDLHDAFTDDGFTTILCATGAEAREAFTRAEFDAAVLDVLLPDADGLELLTELRASAGHANVVTMLLSVESDVSDRLAGLRIGADEYIGKPYDAGYVVARTRQLLGGQPSGRAAGGAPAILVIDDSMTFRERLRELLEPEGYTVLTASGGEEGLRMAADRRPDAVIVDGVMPGVDGATVIRRIRLDPALRDTPCLLMTAADDYATEMQMLDAGADAFVRKQQDLAVVLAKLAAVLRQSAEQLPIEGIGGLHGPGKVLTVTPDRDEQECWAEALRTDGYDIVACRDVTEALALLGEQPADCMVLGFDHDLAAAQAACRRVREVPQVGDIPVVVVGREDHMLECLAAGADDYVRSSDVPEGLRVHVRAQIRRKQSHDEARRIREELMRRELDAAEERAARQLAETRAAMVEELEWRNRELEAFSGSVSHDLRGPLQVISSFAEHMLDEADDEQLGEQTRHRLGRIHAAALRMADLVESLLILARASRGELRRARFDMTATARQVCAEVAARDPDHKVDFQVQEGMTADADEGLVRVILENLVNNAVKFTRKVERPVITVGFADDTYFVRDNGAGFPAGKAGELFRPFARLHDARDFPGTGIGLTTVHRAIERHGGEIRAEGEEGQGATFRFSLPPADGPPGPERRGQARRSG